MKVLFLMFAFPDLDKGSNMHTAIVEEFYRNGQEIYVIAPKNNSGKTGIRTEKGIHILRVKVLPIKNVPNLIKGISNILLPWQYRRALNKYYPGIKFDLIFMPTPPVTLAGLASELKILHNASVYLLLRDIFPQNAVDLGLINKKGMIYRYFRRLEIKLYKTADHIGCMSEENQNYILSRNKFLQKSKLHLLPNFQILNKNYPLRDPSIRTIYGLHGKFIVVFGGNMGKPQQIENIVALAKECEEYTDVVFLLLGEGVQKRKIEAKYRADGIKNIKLIDTIPKSEYQKLVSVCEVGLISLNINFTIPNIPSKTLDYFNLGIPVLASIDHSTDYWKILDDAQAGLWSYAGDIKSFKNNFDKLYLNPLLREEMGSNGRRYFENFLTPERAYCSIIKKLNEN